MPAASAWPGNGTGQDHLHPCAGGPATIGVLATGGTAVEHHEGALTRGRPPGPPAGEFVSGFSKVDQSAEPARLVAYLDEAAVWLWGLKHYVAAAHALRRPTKPVLDLGSGTGHDLALLESFGLRAIGVEPRETMLAAARSRDRSRRGRLVQAVGEALPFSDGAFGGCRIERVLIHVAEPAPVLRETCRCVERGGLVTVLEPDWLRLEVTSDVLPPGVGWLSGVAHPGVGGELWRLVEEAGCQVLDRVEELSVWRSLATLERVTGFPASVDRAVAGGRLGARVAQRWVEEQRQSHASGRFEAKVAKVLVVARRS